MRLTCAGCKTNYDLTPGQIQGLKHSILPCNKCGRFIKITICPHCRSFYSVTFSSVQQSRYELDCGRCGRRFFVDFPRIRDPIEVNDRRPDINRETKAPEMPPPAPGTRERSQETAGTGAAAQAQGNFSFSRLLSISSSAFTMPKLFTAGMAVILSVVLIVAYNRLVSQLFSSGSVPGHEYIKSLLSIAPFAILFFIYIMTAAVISRITMDDVIYRSPFNARRTMQFFTMSSAPVFAFNMILFLAISLIVILFGKIPVIGPVLFAVLFLPIYIASLCIVLLSVISVWFYPPVIAAVTSGPASSIRKMALFVRRHNFRLAFTIPLLAGVSALIFAVVYLLHYGSFAISLFLIKNVLAEEGEKILSAVPSKLLQISNVALLGSDSGLFKSLLSDLLITHAIGGLVIGIALAFISITLFACFISITATLSTHIYLMMERGTDIDDAGKLRLFLLMVLILAVLFLGKKLLF